MTKKIVITEEIQELIRGHAWITDEEECCGLLVGNKEGRITNIFPIPNDATDPVKTYTAWPMYYYHLRQHLDNVGLIPLAVYHSHPNSELVPSKSDLLFADAGLIHIITNFKETRAWIIGEDESVREMKITTKENG